MKKTAIGVLALAGVGLTASAVSADVLTTIYGRNNGGSNGGAVYFNVTVGSSNIEVTGFDTNTLDLVTFGWTVYTFAGSYVGNTGSNVGWTQVATGTGQGMGQDVPSPVTLNNSFTLLANTTYGMALVMGPEAGHDYSGTGTSPAPAALQYSNSALTLDLGSAGNVPFAGSAFTPRVWNGSIYYDIPSPSSLALLGLGGLLAARRRRA